MTTNADDTKELFDSSKILLDRAHQRAQIFGLPFAGAVYPPEAWTLVRAGAATLIDVRTAEERKLIGRVPEIPHVAWKLGPDMAPNLQFVQQIEAVASKDAVVLLLCRSGVRSAAAAEALTQAGYTNAINVLEGFEGELDNHQQRGTFNGWRYHDLPWIQD